MTNEKVDRMRLSFHVLGTTVLALLLNSLPAFSQLSVPLITQEALPPNTPGLARRTEPVTVGVPLSDSQGVSSVSQLGLSGVSVGQFRCLGRWPSANCKWVEIDYELPALAAGGSKTVTLTYGKGNFGGRDLAADSRPNDASAGTITVNTGVGGCVFTIQKARFDVLHMVVCDGRTLVDGGSTGLTLMGPAYAAKPASTTCAFDSTCAALYASSNDPSSACVVEE